MFMCEFFFGSRTPFLRYIRKKTIVCHGATIFHHLFQSTLLNRFICAMCALLIERTWVSGVISSFFLWYYIKHEGWVLENCYTNGTKWRLEICEWDIYHCQILKMFLWMLHIIIVIFLKMCGNLKTILDFLKMFMWMLHLWY
jgi:hypothetical protein